MYLPSSTALFMAAAVGRKSIYDSQCRITQASLNAPSWSRALSCNGRGVFAMLSEDAN
jgi:hypothetical protein